jgi:hypothetical protein
MTSWSRQGLLIASYFSRILRSLLRFRGVTSFASFFCFFSSKNTWSKLQLHLRFHQLLDGIQKARAASDRSQNFADHECIGSQLKDPAV